MDENEHTKLLMEERESYNRMDIESSGRLDRWLLTLSGGALAVSLTFVRDIAPHPVRCTVWVLVIGWFLLVLSIVMALSSHLTSLKAIRSERDRLDDVLGKKKALDPDTQESKAGKWTGHLNVLSTVALAVGIVLICIFAALNLAKG